MCEAICCLSHCPSWVQVKRQREHTALPCVPISSSFCSRNKASTVQSSSSHKIALFPIVPTGEEGRAAFLPLPQPCWRMQGGQPSPRAGQKHHCAVSVAAWPGPDFLQLLPLPRGSSPSPAQSVLAQQLLHHAGTSRLDGAAAGSGSARAAARWESR